MDPHTSSIALEFQRLDLVDVLKILALFTGVSHTIFKVLDGVYSVSVGVSGLLPWLTVCLY